jgi:hypothetical protein
MDPEFYPSDEQRTIGHSGYLRYLAGIAVLNEPSSDFAVSIVGEGVRLPREVILWAEEGLMLDGLVKVIKSANPSTYDLRKAEHSFDTALPFMQDTVERAYRVSKAQIDAMNMGFFALRPLAVRDGNVYRSICHPNVGRILTTTLMDGVQPAVAFRDLLNGRHLRDQPGNLDPMPGLDEGAQ